MMVRARWMLNTWAGVAALGLLTASCKPKEDPAPPAVEEPFEFENPGGMWMPSQLADHQDTLKKLGVAFDPAALTDPTAFPLGAVVSLGGCSASFVSPDGLLVTNHHCVTRALQHNSTPEANLLTDGYLAEDRSKELWAGPGSQVFVSMAFTDVTSQVLDGLDAIAEPHARALELVKRAKGLQDTCEADKPGMRCTVASYFDGAQFIQIEQLHIKDVRLVYAPHAGVGVFGGEVDNWRWPRHTGDYSFLRAYVGADGKPAAHADGNVPYKPPHHLKIATEPLREGDFAMVAGYPGTTYRLKTAAEVQEAVDWYYPQRIARYDQYIALYESMGAQNPELAIKAASRLRGLANYRTNYQGMLDGLSKGGLAQQKAKLETDLQAWIDGDEGRKAKYGTVLADMAALQAKSQERRDYDAMIHEILRASSLLRVAIAIRMIATERLKPEAERKPGYSEAEIEGHIARMGGLASSYDPELDRAVLKLALTRAAALPDGQRPDVMLEAVLGRAAALPLDEAAVDKALGKLYAKTKLGDAATRDKLFSTPLKKIDRSRDPMLQAAATIELVVEDVEHRETEYAGAMATLRPTYVAALREFSPDPLAPDANSTLRVTYGTVRGYRPTPEDEPFTPFTTLSQMVAKNTGSEPFAAPTGILAAAMTKEFGPYADETLGELPVNFLADLDITGGNSGSATLNARGELIGLAFDGNYESIASDWLFIPEVTRSIHVDVRYMMWIMDAVDGADHLLTEMGVTPSLETVPATGGMAPAGAGKAGAEEEAAAGSAAAGSAPAATADEAKPAKK